MYGVTDKVINIYGDTGTPLTLGHTHPKEKHIRRMLYFFSSMAVLIQLRIKMTIFHLGLRLTII